MSGRPWSKKDRATLRRLYADTDTAVLARRLNRTPRSLYDQAVLLGLHKSARYLKRKRRAEMLRLQASGASNRFEKGHKPWNKGKHFDAGGLSVATRFQRGSKPHNWVPVGSERVNADGIRQRKLTDTGYPPRDWKNIHVILWEEHRGPVPKGKFLVFKNRDQTDIRIENLELVDCAENMRRNTRHRYPKEISRLMQLRGALNRQINKRAAHEKQN